MAVIAAGALFAAGCTSDGDSSGEKTGKPDKGSPSASGKEPDGASPAGPPAKGSVKVERTVATGLDSPWGMAALPDGDLLVSSRDTGEILRVDGKSGKKTELGSVPGVAPGGEGGLLGIAVPSGDASMVYAYLTTASDNRIVRMLYDEKKEPGNQLGAPDNLLKGIPKGQIHNGGRIAFGPDKMLYAGTGEAGDQAQSQDKESLGGKILRMTPDGEPPGRGNPEADSVVLSYGHRNVQGLAWDKEERLWASEFGQDTWDELNHIEPGGNYGWPEAEGKAEEEGYADPVEQWRTEDASPSGIAVAEGSVWMASLRGERLWRVPLAGTKPVAKPQAFLEGKYGRLRTVVPDGRDGLWLLTNETDSRGTPEKGDDRILKLKVS
ncbi:PQQ-dependent sugar dehydrogenase [Streptomyces sp. N2-109]|uniref:PQQ-dependent sugar dehydrogenase n=1 Tax=Streptomyces gossypii TaxID=2883101 RepID=A0ABT2JXH7_9ACTN|nr:PQQ-dependent sugar dehydrogenase [Streptomyces gossypii]MCT2592604.1 PQQ-dependent sugar dehydrogenase [Streptomyces gossypii]